jgi:hypothetical protein
VAATSCDTSELTSMTEPPAAPALLLLAIETTGCSAAGSGSGAGRGHAAYAVQALRAKGL